MATTLTSVHTLIMKEWFYWVSLVRLLYDLSGLGIGLVAMVVYMPDSALLSSLELVGWIVSVANGLFLVAHDSRHSNSFIGSLLAQQSIAAVIIILTIGLVISSVLDQQVTPGFLEASTGLTIITSVVLVIQTRTLSRSSGRSVSSYLGANAGDVSMGIQVQSQKLSWVGSPRQTGVNSVSGLRTAAGYSRRSLRGLKRFVLNGFLRRVSPVETIPYALVQNTFAVAAVALVIVRIVILLSQLQNEDFLTRTQVRGCNNGEKKPLSVLLSYPNERRTNAAMSELDIRYYQIKLQATIIDLSNTSQSSTSNCSYAGIYRWYRDASNMTTLYRRYACSDAYTDSLEKIDYAIALESTAMQRNIAGYPSLWLLALPPGKNFIEDDSRINSVPYLTSAIQPSPDQHIITNVTMAIRRFIVSSGIKDAITGSKPSYRDIIFYPWTASATSPVNSTSSICTAFGARNSSTVACGSIQLRNKIRLPAVTETQLKENEQGPYCQVTEDYRESSAFDVLGSIGGLLALLQGIHMFLFGRPLFWGIFGAKLLSPFGLVGRFADRSFRQRLQEHYHARDIQANQVDIHDASSTIRMNRFLLDYVLDMGPAAVPSSPERRPDDVPGSTHAGVELDGLQQHKRYGKPPGDEHTEEPLLDVDKSNIGPSLSEISVPWPAGSQRSER
ncbi:hypothetical protein FRC08_001845 [Ceratobasidium sp. 394]|nr:hypothetical protein FRC08_001845 [Ceratobasidium sp. 394]